MEKLLAAVAQTHGFDDDDDEPFVSTPREEMRLENSMSSSVIRGEISGSRLIGEVSGDVRPSRVVGELLPAPASAPWVIGDGEKRKRGRPPKGQVAANPPPPKRKKIEEVDEDVCFICCDGGSLVLCDRKGCPKAYHKACIKRDDAFFSTKAKWICGWHICRTCEKSSHYMCYTCTYSLCKRCIKDADFLCVRGNKGFCAWCMKTIMLYENKDQATNESAQINFDDTTSFEYFFKVYWLALKENLSLSMSELREAKNPFKRATAVAQKPQLSNVIRTELVPSCDKDTLIPNTDKFTEETNVCKFTNGPGVKEASKESFTGEDQDAVKDTNKPLICKTTSERESDNSGIDRSKWASKDLLEFVSHMNNGDTSPIPQFDVQKLLLNYIKINNLRDPHQKSQIICDPRLKKLFGKPRVGHIEMLKLLESHFLIKEDSQQNSLIPAGFVTSVASDAEVDGKTAGLPTLVNNRKRKPRKKIAHREPPQHGLNEYAAIDVHNINLVYLRRNLVENLINDHDNFHDKVYGSYVRIKISSNDQKPEIFRLVQVAGISKAAEPYKFGDKTADVMLEVLNLDKIEVVSIDAISNLEFTEDECRRLRQSMRCGLIQGPTVGDIQRKALALQSVRVNDWLEAEILRLNHLLNRANEKGHKKELREYVDRLELLKSPKERQRRISELPEIHSDPKMNPLYKSEDNTSNGDIVEIDGHVRPSYSPYPRKGQNSISPNKKGKDDRSTKARNRIIEKAGPSGSNGLDKHINQSNIDRNDQAMRMCGLETSTNSPSADHIETEKLWHYRDPNGRIQGPFSMMQLRKWSTTGLFPPDMRIWTNHELFDSLLLSGALNGKLHGASDLLDKPPSDSHENKATGKIVVSEGTDRTSRDQKQAEGPLSNCASVSSDKNPGHVSADEPGSSGWPHCWDLLKDSNSSADDVQDRNLLPSSSSGKEDVALTDRGQEIDEFNHGSQGEKNSTDRVQESDEFNHGSQGEKNSTGLTQNPTTSEHKSSEEKMSSVHIDLSSKDLVLDSEPIFPPKSSEEKMSSVNIDLSSNDLVLDSEPVIPPVLESSKCSEKIESLDLPSPTPITENQQTVFADVPVQDSGILELLSPAPRLNNEHQEGQASETKQPGFTLFPSPMPGWNCDSTLGIGTLQLPEVVDPWGGFSPTPARPSMQEWDSGPSSSKPPEVKSECIDSHVSTSQPAPDITNWLAIMNEPIEFDALGEESVSDLLAEVDAMESRGAFPSPTSAMKFVREFLDDDCFSSIEEFSSANPQPIKSDAFSSTTTDVQRTSQSSAPCKPMGSSASSEGETNAPVQSGDAASECNPQAPINLDQEMVGAPGPGPGLDATDPSWGAVQGNINLVTVQGNVNLVLVGGPGQGMGNMGWGSNPGPAWTNPNASRSPRNGSLQWDGQRKYSGERFSSPREWGGYQGGGESGFGRGRPPWGRQPYGGGGGGGGGGYPRPLPKGQRVCKFYESGHCKKGAFCDYLHP